MVASYPHHIVKNALRAYYQSNSYRKAAEKCGIGRSTIHKWVQKVGVKPVHAKTRNRTTPVSDAVSRVLPSLLPQLTIFNVPRLCFMLSQQGVTSSPATTWRCLQRFGYTWKKVRLRNVPNIASFHEKRREFATRIAGLNPADVIAVDESSFDSHMCPTHTYSPKGMVFVVPVERPGRQRVSLTLAVSQNQLVHWTIVKGSSNSERFLTFLEGLRYTPHRYVFMDNVSFHTSQKVDALLQSMGKVRVLIPPYSPEFNPIECVFFPVKAKYRPMCYDAPHSSPCDLLEACIQQHKEHLDMQCQGAFSATWAFNP
jgi:transposase